MTYEFVCECDQPTIVRTDIDKRDEPRTCPDCKTLMRRVYSPTGVVFKGTGWGGKR